MAYKVDVLISAEREIGEILEYYSKINVLLPGKFLDNLKSTYRYLEQNPFFQKRYKNIRGVPITNFPFMIFFVVEENLKIVRILSCFHTSQDPMKYPKP